MDVNNISSQIIQGMAQHEYGPRVEMTKEQEMMISQATTDGQEAIKDQSCQ